MRDIIIDWVTLAVIVIGLCGIGAATGILHERQRQSKAAPQPRLWTATLAQEHHQSGLPWKAEIREPTYEAARRTAAERLHWHDKTFMVAPVVENYVDVGQMSITP